MSDRREVLAAMTADAAKDDAYRTINQFGDRRTAVRYSSFNWPHRGKRGWIFGPFFGRLLTITVERVTGEQQ